MVESIKEGTAYGYINTDSSQTALTNPLVSILYNGERYIALNLGAGTGSGWIRYYGIMCPNPDDIHEIYDAYEPTAVTTIALKAYS